MPPAVIAAAPPAAAKLDLKNDRRSRSSVSLNLRWCNSNSGQFLSSPAHMLSLPYLWFRENKQEPCRFARYSLFLFRLFRHPIEAVLHVFHLTAQIIDVVIFGRWFRDLFGFARGSGSHARRHERLEHREGLLKQFHVAANMLFERSERRPAECVGKLLAEFLLLARQRVDGLYEIFRHYHLHAVAVKSDQLPQERGGQQILARLVFLLEDDLRQHRTGDIVTGLGVVDKEILAVLHHRREILERHVGAGAGIIEPSICLFFDRGGLVCFRHGLTYAHRGWEPDGMAEGLRATHRSKGKHFQCGSATVLCGTVNSKA